MASLETGDTIIPAKLVILGEMGTGKTSLALRFVKDQFFYEQESTIGAAFFTQKVPVSEGIIVKLDIWDTAGQERFHSLAPVYYRGAAAAIVVYDISNIGTFVRAQTWVQELQRHGNQKLVMALVANKSDLEFTREVETKEGEQFAEKNGMIFMETSAKTAKNTNVLFDEIAQRVARALPPKPPAINLDNEVEDIILNIEMKEDERRKNSCCST